MFRPLKFAILILILVLAACGQSEEPPPEPLALLEEAAVNVRESQTFRMEVTQSGGDYIMYTEYGSVLFRRTLAQYVAPNYMQSEVRVLAEGIPIDVDLFSAGENQWFRAIWTANQWVNVPFAPGFDPETLIAEDTGFQAALDAMIDLEYIGTENLEDGTPTYHLTATADGAAVSALTVNLIEARGTVQVDVYIHRDDIVPVRFILAEPDDVPEAIEWKIDLYDFNDDPELTPPPDVEIETAA